MKFQWPARFLPSRSFKNSDIQSMLSKVPFIVCGILVGMISVSFAHLSERATSQFIEIMHRSPYWALLLTPIAFITSRFLVQRLGPAAAGSGIPQVMAALDLSEEHTAVLPRLLSLRIALIKILSNLVCLVGGGVGGREGPMVQIAASVFFTVGLRFKKWFPKLDSTTLIASGGAAGIAAAFNTPLGGIVFAIEELIGHHFNRIRSSMIIAVIIAGMVAQSLVGPYLMFGSPSLENPGWSIILPTLLLAAFLGLVGGFTGKIFIEGQTWIAGQSSQRKIAIAGLLGLIVALILVVTPPEEGAGGGIPLIKSLLWTPAEISPWLFFEKWAGMLGTFLSGVASGFFAPSLAVGAIAGKISHLFFTSTSVSTLILVGMASFLSSLTRAPFTSLVLVSEMSNGHSVIMPVMLGSLVALGIARWLEPRSYYHYQSRFWVKTLVPNLIEPKSHD